jgi:hypothetical protein
MQLGVDRVPVKSKSNQLKPKTAFEKELQPEKAFQTLIISLALAMGPSVNDAVWKPRQNGLDLKCKESRINVIPVVERMMNMLHSSVGVLEARRKRIIVLEIASGMEYFHSKRTYQCCIAESLERPSTQPDAMVTDRGNTLR